MSRLHIYTSIRDYRVCHREDTVHFHTRYRTDRQWLTQGHNVKENLASRPPPLPLPVQLIPSNCFPTRFLPSSGSMNMTEIKCSRCCKAAQLSEPPLHNESHVAPECCLKVWRCGLSEVVLNLLSPPIPIQIRAAIEGARNRPSPGWAGAQAAEIRPSQLISYRDQTISELGMTDDEINLIKQRFRPRKWDVRFL